MLHKLIRPNIFCHIRLQEVIVDVRDENGRIPRTIECELSEDLVNKCNPGDLVTMSGTAKALNLEESGSGRSSRDKSTYVMYIAVNSFRHHSAEDKSKQNLNNFEFSQVDLELFQSIKNQTNPFKWIVNSLSPSIYGHELVKAGLVLGLFGGSKKDEIYDLSIRNDIHVLIVGDPGLGKVNKNNSLKF